MSGVASVEPLSAMNDAPVVLRHVGGHEVGQGGDGIRQPRFLVQAGDYYVQCVCHRSAGVGSVSEVARSGQYHRHAELVGGFDALVVAYRAAGLGDGGYAARRRHLDIVREREEGVGRER